MTKYFTRGVLVKGAPSRIWNMVGMVRMVDGFFGKTRPLLDVFPWWVPGSMVRKAMLLVVRAASTSKVLSSM